MNKEEIARKFETLKVWQRGDQRAPHKPLLVLYAIGNLLRGEGRLLPYSEVDERLGILLREFGPKRKQYHPEFPFWRLQNDGVWEIPGADSIEVSPRGDVRRGDLFLYEIAGGFTEDIAQQLQDDSSLAFDIVQNMLSAHFPNSIHEDILQAAGIEFAVEHSDNFERSPKRKTARKSRQHSRDPKFRATVLKAYEYRCAVCGFDVRLGLQPVALEAAHIKWHQAGGPDVEANGLALCSLHHKLFDRGAFTLSNKLEILVSDDAHGSAGFDEWRMRFHGEKLNFPQRQTYYPSEDFTRWHVREVFQGEYREL